jgi:hypothetical protein
MRLTGFEAIEYAEKEGLSLNKAADNIDDEATGLTVAEAEAIATDNPDLIWVDVPGVEQFGDRKGTEDFGGRVNMEPER